MEIYKKINNLNYEISNTGKVKSLWTNKVLKNNLCRGYEYVNLYSSSGCKKYRIHRLVAEYFIHNCENKPCVNHIDSNRSNNNVENLEWCTYSENNIHACRSGSKIQFGEKHSQNKLVSNDIFIIRWLILLGLSNKRISEIFDVSSSNISAIRNKRSWNFL